MDYNFGINNPRYSLVSTVNCDYMVGIKICGLMKVAISITVAKIKFKLV